MTEISFHFNVPDKLAYACRLLRKAVNGGAKVVVAGDVQSLAPLDTALWTFSPLDFVPHCFHDSDAILVAASPVVLGYPGRPVQATPSSPPGSSTQVLLNSGQDVPEGFERFERLIELVGMDDEDRQAARQRWKHYASRGYAITRHDLAQAL
jgi:DNA polymerase-3 subunit chi